VSSLVGRYLHAFGAFWYDFLVGDRPELFIGSIAILAAIWAAIQVGLEPGLAGLVLAALLFGLAGWSLWRASRPSPEH